MGVAVYEVKEASFWAGVLISNLKDVSPNKVVLHGNTNHELVYALGKFLDGRVRYNGRQRNRTHLAKWTITHVNTNALEAIARAIDAFGPSVNPLRLVLD